MSMFNKLYMFILGAWFFLTCFIDFIAVPTIFRTVSKISEAGQIGVKVFTFFNGLEMIFIVLIWMIYFWLKPELTWKKFIMGMWAVCTVLVATYTFYVTPQIVEAFQVKEGMDPLANKDLIESTMANFHEMYKVLDGVKILILIFMIGLEFRRKPGVVI